MNIYDVNFSGNSLCATESGEIPRPGTRTYTCPTKTEGRYVSVQKTLDNSNDWFSFCELMVFGS